EAVIRLHLADEDGLDARLLREIEKGFLVGARSYGDDDARGGLAEEDGRPGLVAEIGDGEADLGALVARQAGLRERDPAAALGAAADYADGRRRVDRPLGRLVVEGDIAGDDRRLQRLARLRHPEDRLTELPEARRLLRRREVQAVGDRLRRRADARQVPRGL